MFNYLGIGEEKNKDYFERVAKYIAAQAYGIDNARQKALDLRATYNLAQNHDSYETIYNPLVKSITDDYGKKIEDIKVYKNPIQVKQIPILRSRINGLISEERLRPIDYKVTATDIVSNQLKMEAFAEALFTEQYNRYLTQQAFLQQQQQNLELQKQLQGEQLQNIPEQERQAMLYDLNVAFKATEEQVQRAILFNDKELEEFRKNFERTYLSNEELFCSLIIDWFMSTNNLRTTFNWGFREKLLNDNEIYFVDWDYNTLHPIIRAVPRERLWIPFNDYAPRIQQLDMIAEINMQNISSILAEFAPVIDKDMLEKLKHTSSYSYGPMMSKKFVDFQGNLISSLSTFNQNTNYLHRDNLTFVTRCYWKCVEEQHYKFVPSRTKGGPESIYQISDEEYLRLVGKKTDKFRVEKRYRTDLCSAVVLNNADILYAGKHKVQVRINDSYTNNWLPYVGKNNSVMNSTISVFELGNDIQDTINILYYQSTLLIVLAGVKGLVYDLSQKPLDMDIDEIMFYRSQGMTFIETLGPDGKQRSSFNQFQNYDDGVSSSINIILGLIENYKQVLNEVTAIPDSRSGIVESSARVGNTQHEFRQSMVVTENLFVEHEETIEEVLTRLAMLVKVAYKDGYDFGQFYSHKEQMNRMLTVPASVLTAEFRVNTSVGREQSENLKLIKEIAKKKVTEGLIKDTHFVELMAEKNFSNIYALIKKYEDDAEKLKQAISQQNEQQRQAIFEQAKARELEEKKMLEDIKTARERERLQVQIQKLQLEKYIKETEIATWNKDIETKAEVAMEGINKEAEIETAYLEQRYVQARQQIDQNNASALLGLVKDRIKQSQPKEKIKD